MSVEKIKADLDRLEQKLKDKGCCNISVSVQIYPKSSVSDYMSISYRSSVHGEYKSHTGYETYEKNLADAHAHIDELPDQTAREQAEFYALVQRAANFGRSIGMDETLLNPLGELAKRLASNALTGPKTVEHSGDDIPF